MQSVCVYKALSDQQRLRILNLLHEGPLCVCHLVQILRTDQVKMSKQLKYMKVLGLLEAEREANWMIYRLAPDPHPLLEANLSCLREAQSPEAELLRTDLRQRKQVLTRIACTQARAPEPVRLQALASS